jgi:hypothetical protein
MCVFTFLASVVLVLALSLLSVGAPYLASGAFAVTAILFIVAAEHDCAAAGRTFARSVLESWYGKKPTR